MSRNEVLHNKLVIAAAKTNVALCAILTLNHIKSQFYRLKICYAISAH